MQHPESSPQPPCSTPDFAFFYEGLANGQLLIQQCRDCGTLRNPPMPLCAICASFAWVARPMAGTGTLFSYTIHYHPPLIGFPSPHPVGLVELTEGIRFVGAMDGVPLTRIAIGMPLELEFLRRGGVPSLRFRMAGGAPAEPAP